MKTAIIFLSVILLLANCQPEDYELTFFDSKTNSMNGKLFNAAEIYSYDPFILKFPGCGECYFQYPEPKLFKGDMTFAVWARWEAWHSWSRLFDFGNGANTNNIGCANTGGSSSLTCFHYVAPSQTTQKQWPNFLQLNFWVHLTIVYTAVTGDIVVYKNGYPVISTVCELCNIKSFPQDTRNNLYVGKSNWGDAFFNGFMSEWKFFSRILNQDEITSLYQKKTIRPVEYGLDGWKMLTFVPQKDQFKDAVLYGATMGEGVATNKAFFFNGQQQYVQLGTTNIGGAMTFVFWAKWDALNNWSRIFETSNGPDSNNIVIANEGTSNVFAWEIQEFAAGATRRRRTKVLNGIEVGTWAHWACTSDNYGYMQIFKNGVLAAKIPLISGPLEHVSGASVMQRSQGYLGKSTYPQDGYFKGAIDDFRLYNRVLTYQEILRLADRTRKVSYQSEPKHYCEGVPYAELYSECNFQGEVFYVCDQNPEIKISWEIKSVKLQKNYQLQLFDGTNYLGGQSVITQDVPCFDTPIQFQ